MDNIKNDKYYLLKIINDIDKVISYSKGLSFEEFLEDEIVVDSILFRLIQISESIKKLSTDFKNKHNNIPWIDIAGFRNRIVHDYDSTDYSIVYEIVKKDLPEIRNILITNIK
jgi:uncharacterized protein with HEPN domain